MDKLQLTLHQQLQDIQCLTKQEVFQTLRDNLHWLNPKNWFDGLNLRMWIFGATGCLLIIIILCVLRCIYKLFSQGRVRDQQVASFVGSIAVLTKNKGGNVGNCSKRGKCGSAPTWKTSEVGGQDPHPWISSPVGNQACIVLRLLGDLLLLKLPHPELRKQMFTEYLYLPRIWARPPSMGQSLFDHFFFYIANIPL